MTSLEMLQQKVAQYEAVLLLFGGEGCQVCHHLRPKIEVELERQFPKMVMIYVDCHQITDLCAQKGVLSLPTVQGYFSGQQFFELVRTFSVSQLMAQIERPYRLLFSEV